MHEAGPPPSGDDHDAAGPRIGDELHALASAIYPICRSITGDGVRETLLHLGAYVPLTVHEVPSGTQVFDWTVPREWNLHEAYIESETGERVVDMRESNLHVLNYSVPVDVTLPLSELKRHVHTLPGQPGLIPYRTSYYSEEWGFCMQHERLEALPQGHYRAVIRSTLEPGSLTYGEYLKPGDSDEEVLLSAHICHPSLANDNCSGLAVLARLARQLSRRPTRYSYRFLFAPGTIGSLTWLARNPEAVTRIRHGLVVSCVGDGGGPTYKKSRRGNAQIDRVMTHVLHHAGPGAEILDFFPYGYDERQFCSPGFDLPVGLFQRSRFGNFPEYHTSADDLDFIRPEHLAKSYSIIGAVIGVLENDYHPMTLNPCGEPQLGRRGLYDSIGGKPIERDTGMAYLWIMNLADGNHTLLDIAERAGMPFRVVLDAARRLLEAGLIARHRG